VSLWQKRKLFSEKCSTRHPPNAEEPPLRAELLSLQQLDHHARDLAVQHNAVVCRGTDQLLPRLSENEKVLREAHDVVTSALANKRRIAPAAEWLLDNFYLIQQQIHQTRLHLPRTYSRRLPRLTSGPMAGFPRVYHMAVDLISHLDGQLDAETTTRFVSAYQAVLPLSLGELWAFPIALRLGLIENLRRVASRIAYRRHERDAGIAWAERMIETATEQTRTLIHLLGEFADTQQKLSAPFLEEFSSRLRGHGASVTFVLNWVEHALLDEETTETRLLHADSRAQAAEQISIANSIGSLRFLGAMNWKEFVETLSVVDASLRHDPSGAYAEQDFETRDRYRHVIEHLSERSGKDEAAVAHAVLDLAEAAAAREGNHVREAHVGHYLIDRGLRTLRRALGCRRSPCECATGLCSHGSLWIYLGAIFTATASISAGALLLLPSFWPYDARFWLLTVSAVLAASSLAVSLVNLLATRLVPPRPLPRLDFSNGIPSDHRTMVVVPCLLQDESELNSLLEALEIRYLGNRDSNLFFALLTDFTDADAEVQPGDNELLEAAYEGITALNKKYPRLKKQTAFYLFHRPRVWNPNANCWMGYERKRGKLGQFNALLRGEQQEAFSATNGNLSVLRSIKYVITLDADTDLPRGAGHRLTGAMAHPLNRPQFDPIRGRVVEGYAILQPRASIRLTSACRSRFSQLFSGESGIDPYTREVSDVYQDLFGEGSFVGKGIYDVDAFRQALDGRFPENRILSHDLLESGYARSALFSSVEVHEEFPSSYLGDISRQHRWIRGDWQIARWLFPHPPTGTAPHGPNPLSALSRWKLFDNVRRSLFAPALLTWLLVGWLLVPSRAWGFSLFAIGILLFSGVLRTLTHLLRKPRERGWRPHLSAAGRTANTSFAQAFLSMAFLPYEAFTCASAIARVGIRIAIGQRGLLSWNLSSYKRRNGRRHLFGFAIEMWPSTAVAVTAGALLCRLSTPGLFASCAPFLAAWLLSPWVAWWISRPLQAAEPDLTTAQWQMLRTLARRTWRYFERFVGVENNWLPPDNIQESPTLEIATRTSPTNLGLALLANLSAWDFGYIPTGRLLERTRLMLDAMDKLERYQGHFYNWYDTQNLRVLTPAYISSVDSGNLLGALVALRGGLEDLRRQPVLTAAFTDGLRDTLEILKHEAGSHPTPELDRALQTAEAIPTTASLTLSESVTCLTRWRKIAASLEKATAPIGGELAVWAQSIAVQCNETAADLSAMIPEQSNPEKSGTPMPSLEQLADTNSGWPPEVRRRAAKRLQACGQLIKRCQEMESAMDFRFLYDTSQDLLSIGFDVDARRRDPGCYDLLASESRLASFLLVAGEQAPPDHWFALGRLLTGSERNAALISWSGSMFEYLMPALLMPHYRNTLLDRTCRSVIERQIRYGRQRNIPWGISESCFNTRDIHQIYQYRAFGVPGLGLQRGLASDLVVAPYATMLALPFAPREACENLQRLATKEGALGAYGMYEAIDYTPARILRGKSRAVVHAFMTHHQGMGLISLSNLLLNNPMVHRFMADPSVRATDLLLQERMPQSAPILQPHEREVQLASSPVVVDLASMMRIFPDPDTLAPEVHLLSNGNYHVMVTNAGGGYSRWRDLALTRWREDVTCDNYGAFVYLRDVHTPDCWSAAYHPTGRHSDHYEAIYTQGRAEFRRRDQDIETHTEICVSPEDDVEIRRITLSNFARKLRQIEITSFAEVVLAPQNSDMAHPVFSKLFVQTEILADRNAILCSRRKRAPSDSAPWMFHVLVVPGATETPSFETDRARFIGRGRRTPNPVAMDAIADQSFPLENSAGAVLDPIVAARQVVEVPTDSATVVNLITGVAETREAALALVDKYLDRHFVDRAFEMAWSHSQIILRMLNVSEAETQMYGRLAGSMLYAHARLRAAPSVISQNQLGQQGLWHFGISGDLPIMLLRIGNLQRMDRVTDAVRAHAYWRMKGLTTDLVIFNEDFSGYRATLNDRIMEAIHAGADAGTLDKPGGIFVRRTEDLTEEDRILLQTTARVVLTDSAETLQEQVDRRTARRRLPPTLRPTQTAEPEQTPTPLPPRNLIFENGPGGFTPDGREYVIALEPGQTTPAPWCNVIASPHIGTVVSESGGMYTWAGNAHEFRITPWYNDPVSDSSGEAFYLRDEETGRFWSLMPLPAPGRKGYLCRHGFGYSVFEHDEDGIFTEAWTYVAMDAPVKFVTVKVTNHSGRKRRLSLSAFYELALGEWRHANAMHIVTESDPQTGALFAYNPYSREFADKVVFASCSEPNHTLTGSRTEFLGRNGSFAAPSALLNTRLSNVTGAGFDPGAGLQAMIELSDGQTLELVFTLGAADHTNDAHLFLSRFGGRSGARQALEAVWAHWNDMLGAVYVETPDVATNVLMNGWLLYQTLSCRVWGRSGYYQSGGAFGFRDQLQDTMALVHAMPQILREQILLCAAHQFKEGDVQHWWHPPGGAGVRTHFSDDYLWLPQAVACYVTTTGDTSILDERVPFLEGRPVDSHEESYYEVHAHASESGTLYEHCLRALKRGLHFGAHGLPLMGCGDWNDGMNLIGEKGKGESVWLAWFLIDSLTRFAEVARLRGDSDFVAFSCNAAETLKASTEASAWDGDWYRRAYFDDGTPLGSASNDECQIDSLSQSWAVISKAAQPERARQAMQAVQDKLVRADDGMIALFTPPFDKTALEPGYIKGYPAGMRENGGQYTHGAVWSVMATALLGKHDQAWDLFNMLNPITHGDSPEKIACYKVEPYVMAADVYGVAPYVGRGGWTWYTGAAGWMYRLGLETLLGFEQRNEHLHLTPRVPTEGWASYRIHYRYRKTVYHIEVRKLDPADKKGSRVIVDGIKQPDDRITLSDDHQDHFVEAYR